jgi:hypothetical protein
MPRPFRGQLGSPGKLSQEEFCSQCEVRFLTVYEAARSGLIDADAQIGDVVEQERKKKKKGKSNK